MVDKEKGACDIALAPQALFHKLELNLVIGAVVGLEPVQLRIPITVQVEDLHCALPHCKLALGADTRNRL